MCVVLATATESCHDTMGRGEIPAHFFNVVLQLVGARSDTCSDALVTDNERSARVLDSGFTLMEVHSECVWSSHTPMDPFFRGIKHAPLLHSR